jgi:hypothetical protein
MAWRSYLGLLHRRLVGVADVEHRSGLSADVGEEDVSAFGYELAEDWVKGPATDVLVGDVAFAEGHRDDAAVEATAFFVGHAGWLAEDLALVDLDGGQSEGLIGAVCGRGVGHSA